MSRQLTQQEIDAVFQKQDRKRDVTTTPFDFRRPDRIPKSQVRAIHLLHDVFARNLVSSLSAYLRSYLTVNLVSVEQLSYSEFLEGLPSPTCLVSMGLKPYDGNGVLELNPSLAFPIIEMLLGGSGKQSASIQRDITEIEQKLLDGLLRIILNDLREAWKGVTEIDFSIESMDTEPQTGECAGAERGPRGRGCRDPHCGSSRHEERCLALDRNQDDAAEIRTAVVGSQNPGQRSRAVPLAGHAFLSLEARLEGLGLSVENLLSLSKGHVVIFDRPVSSPVSLLVNGREQHYGQIVSSSGQRCFTLEQIGETEPTELPAANSDPSLPEPEKAVAVSR